MTGYSIAQVGIDTPLRTTFDYRIPAALGTIKAGMRVLVPFGHRRVVGIVLRLSRSTHIGPSQLKDIHDLLDAEPLLNHQSLTLITWAAEYYQFPVGSALFSALPPLLRKAKQAKSTHGENSNIRWLASTKQSCELQRAPKQAAIYHWLLQQPHGASIATLIQQFPNCRSSLLGLEKRGMIAREIASPTVQADSPITVPIDKQQLTPDQLRISIQLRAALDAFSVHLIEGVTGSGKTEVYFQVIEDVLAQQDSQVLILVPEIGLAPQMLQRLQQRFGSNIGVLHSGIRETERKQTWLDIGAGKIRIILGTRLAVFTPIPFLKLIIVDEEHDTSFKQHEGFLYHARDVAIYRAQKEQIPTILGSATPSFETLHNARQQKYHHHVISKRAQSASLPVMTLVDMRNDRGDGLLSATLEQAMHKHLQQGRQVILFLNRRGYAPALICHDCGWVAKCSRCDANLTYHSDSGAMICHHCERSMVKPANCPQCGSEQTILIGHGTQRIEEDLRQRFASFSQVRLDRDVTRRKGALEKILAEIRAQKHQIIIGTQMLSKGHDFPNVSLVGVLDVDYGIFSSDFRALERTAQLLVQVAGRSGRREIQGEVIVQTHAPDHPLLNSLLNSGYPEFAAEALRVRAEWGLPPYAYQVALRASSLKSNDAFDFLNRAKQLAARFLPGQLQIIGPISPNMEKKAGQYRANLLLTAKHRKVFSGNLSQWLQNLDKHPGARKVRWTIDVDPIDSI